MLRVNGMQAETVARWKGEVTVIRFRLGSNAELLEAGGVEGKPICISHSADTSSCMTANGAGHGVPLTG